MQKDADLERRNMEINILQQDRNSLDRLLQEKDSEIRELQTRLQAAVVSLLKTRAYIISICIDGFGYQLSIFHHIFIQDKNIALTETNAQLDAKVHDAQTAQSRAQLTQTRLEQEKQILEKGNKWLAEELERKSEAYAQERRKATDTILDLQRRLSEAESTSQRLQAEHDQVMQQLEQQRSEIEVGVLSLLDTCFASSGFIDLLF